MDGYIMYSIKVYLMLKKCENTLFKKLEYGSINHERFNPWNSNLLLTSKMKQHCYKLFFFQKMSFFKKKAKGIMLGIGNPHELVI